MKLFLVFVSFILSHHLFAQAKELNALLGEYALNKFQWEKHPPRALQDSRELFVPHITSRDTLQLIKWKDIDSCRIIKFCEGSARIVLYGKVATYINCNAIERGCVRFFDRLYKAGSYADSVFIPLPHDLFFDKILERFKVALRQLKSIPINEYDEPVQAGQHIPYNGTIYKIDFCFDCNCPKRHLVAAPWIFFYNESTCQILICHEASDRKKPFHVYANKIRNAKQVSLEGFDTIPEGPVSVIGFTIYIVKAEVPTHFFNEGEFFNQQVLQMIQTLEPGDLVIFDNMQVQTADGTKRTIQAPGFKVE